MTLKLQGVEGAGDLENERVTLRAVSNVNVGAYIVLRAKKSPDGKVFSGAIPHAYWFDTFSIKAGDWLVLYSKSGQKSQKITDMNITSYFFYWGQPSPLWTPDFKPAVIFATGWEWPG
jgi:hypothetical protein